MTDIQEAQAETRTCTCHPDDRPLTCQRKFASRECNRADLARTAFLFAEGSKRLYEQDKRGDMWFAELFWFLKKVQAELEL